MSLASWVREVNSQRSRPAPLQTNCLGCTTLELPINHGNPLRKHAKSLAALLSGQGPGERNEIFYFDAAGNLNAVRYKDWKMHFTIMEGAIDEAYRKTPSWPLIVNLRMDPFEDGPDSALYIREFYADQMWMFVPAQALAGSFLAAFKDFPPSMGDSLSIDAVINKMKSALS